jgi:MFS family permease
MACFGYGTVLFALTGAKLFTELYGFSTAQTGLMLSIPLLIGGVTGELNAGWVTDWLSNRHAQRNNGDRLPEARLTAIFGAILLPVGVIIEGVCLSHSKTASWVGSAFGMGIANMGLQIATTTIYTYATDVSSVHPEDEKIHLLTVRSTSATNLRLQKSQRFLTFLDRYSLV